MNYFLLGVVLVCLMMDIEYSIAEETLHDFAVDFSHEKTLADEELNSVAELAYLAGIGEISLIRTVHMPPSSNYMILVREKSTDNGPYLRYRVLSVGSEKFFYKDSQSRSRELAKSRGGVIIDGFWEVGIRSVNYFPIDFKGENVEIRVNEGVERDDLIRIVSALRNNWVEFPFDEFPLNDTHGVWSNVARGLPNSIGLSPKIEELGQPDYVLYYGDSGTSYSFYVFLEGNDLVILAYGMAVS